MKTIAFALVLFLGAEQEKRRPVPSPEAQKQTERVVHEVFKENFAKTGVEERLAFAEMLVQQAVETNDNPVARFVLLRESCELAAQTGAWRLAVKAIDVMSRHFDVDSPALKISALAAASQNIKTSEDAKMAAEAYLDIAGAAIQDEQPGTAEKAATAAGGLARKAKDLLLIGRSDGRLKDVLVLKSRLETLVKAREALAKTPDDPAANLTLGTDFCLHKGNWEKGLLHLAKGADAALQLLAARDLQNPSDPPEQVAMGDGWWEQGEKEKDRRRLQLRSRAAYWYGQAYPKLSGITRAKVERRLEEAGPAGVALVGINLFRLIDPAQDSSVEGTWGRADGALVSPVCQWAKIQIPYLPPDDYDLRVVVERKRGWNGLEIGLVSRGTRFTVAIDGWDGNMAGMQMIDGKNGSQNETTYHGKCLAMDMPATVLCSVRSTGVVVSVDGKTIIDWKGDFRRVTAFKFWQLPNKDLPFVGAYETCFHVHAVSLIPLSGEGRKLR